MAGRSGRLGELVAPEERERFLQSLENNVDESWMSSDEESAQEQPQTTTTKTHDDNAEAAPATRISTRQSRNSASRGHTSSEPATSTQVQVQQEEDEGCTVCGKDDDHNNLMLCDKCQGQYHAYCLDPPLQDVPKGDWFCPKCIKEMHARKIDDGLDTLVCALPPRYTERFGEIVWANGGVGFGWWPAFIYDPRLTVGSARDLARKNLGKRHLVFFLECLMAPFSVLGENKLVKWERGLSEDYHLGKAAHGHSKARGMMFRQALHIACLEESKPIAHRMAWNHVGYDAHHHHHHHHHHPDEHIPLSPVVHIKRKKPRKSPEEKKLERERKRKKTEKRKSSSKGAKKKPTDFYCKVVKRGTDESDDENDEPLGFVRLKSRNATFGDVRAAILNELDRDSLPAQQWKFYVPSLGPVSARQERQLGPVAKFLDSTFARKLGEGTVEKPYQIVLVGANRTARQVLDDE